MPLLGLLNHAATLPEMLSTEKSTTGMSLKKKKTAERALEINGTVMQAASMEDGKRTTTDYLLRGHGGLHIAT